MDYFKFGFLFQMDYFKFGFLFQIDYFKSEANSRLFIKTPCQLTILSDLEFHQDLLDVFM